MNNIGPAINNGFRVKSLQLRNFGGYHLRTTRFQLNCNGAVFSGPNGAGKSTALDAIRLIFVERPRYNSASGESATSGRSTESYYRGQYGSTGKGERTSKQDAKCLRNIGMEQHFMAIMMVFEDTRGECFTAGRFLLIRANGKYDWQNFTCPGDLSLKDHFPKWQTAGSLARMLAELGGILHNTISDYLTALGDALGFTNPTLAFDAFRNFESAIGVKEMKSVNGFARDYLLPADNFSVAIENAMNQIRAGIDSINEVKMVEDQIKHIEAMKHQVSSYIETNKEVLSLHEQKVLIKVHEQFVGILMERTPLNKAKADYTKLKNEREALQTRIDALRAEDEALTTKINSDELHRAQELKKEHATLSSIVAGRLQLLQKLEGLAAELNMKLDAESETGWIQSKNRIQNIHDEAEAALNDLRVQQAERNFAKTNKEKEISDLKGDIAYLEKSGSNLHSHSVRFRTKLAEELCISIHDIPFACELIRIREGEEAWEGVANRVLDGVARQLLVAPELYSRVVEIMNANHWSGKVTVFDPSRPVQGSLDDLCPDTLGRKLEVKDHPFAAFAETIIMETADHRCVANHEIGKATGKCCTATGTVKTSRRAEKDDRHRVNDRSKYILAWDNKAIIEALKQTLAGKEGELKVIKDVLLQLEGGIKVHNKRYNCAQSLVGGVDGWKPYTQIETASLKTELDTINAELNRIDSTEMGLLLKRREEVKEGLAQALENMNAFFNKEGSLTQQIASRRDSICGKRENIRVRIGSVNQKVHIGSENRNLLRKLLSEATAELGLGDVESYRKLVNTRADQISRVFLKMRGSNEEKTRSKEKSMTSTLNALQRRADKYLEEWSNEGQHLESRVTIEENGDLLINYRIFDIWIEALNQKIVDDLPRCKNFLENELDATVDQHISAIETEISNYDKSVGNMISNINTMLADVPYDPAKGTRAVLVCQDTENEHIELFKSKFSNIIRNAHNTDSREVMRQLQDLLMMVADDGMIETKKRRDKILSLANWKDVYVEEQFFDDNGNVTESRTYRGHDGASGGQGERLTMLLLGAAQSYAMGGADPTRTATGLQTIVLDEAFLRSSSETAQASTDILTTMGLQVIAATPAEKLGAFENQAEHIFSITSDSKHRTKAQPVKYKTAILGIEEEQEVSCV